MQKQNKSGKNVVAFAALAAAVAGVGIASDSNAAVLGTYRFMGSDPSGDLDAPTQTGLTYGTFTRTNVTQVNTNNIFNSNAWTTAGSIDTNEHVSFTVTPVTGYRLNAQSITFTHARSGGGSGGPTAGEVRHSENGFASAGGAYTPSNTTTWNFADFSTTNATTFRFHAWGASNASGTLSFDDVAITGDVQARASLNTSVTTSAAPRVIINAANIRHSIGVTNDALAAGTIATEGLDYGLGLSGASGLSLASPSSGTGLAGAASATHFVDVDTSSVGTKGGTLTVSSTNAFRANGVNGATSASPSLSNVDVVDHSNASLDGSGDVNTILLDFGTVLLNSSQSLPFSISNLVATAGYTAALDLDSFGESGDTFNKFASTLATFSNLAAGGSQGYSVSLDTTTQGTFTASYSLNLSDENIAGATGGQTLTINVTGNVVPEPTSLAVLAGVAGLATLRRRRRSA